MARKRGRALTGDDLAVWRQVARTARPLQKDGGVSPDPAPKHPKPTAERRPTEPAPARPHAPFRVGQAARGVPPGHNLASPIERQLAQHPVRMDAKTFGKLKRGKMKPERKLDLHGLTLAQAQPVLTRFIRECHADGVRLVCVITGKGKSGKDEGGPIPTPRGVLRHQVPGWLHGPALRPYILQVTDAHVRHGGEGAYYVYLTRHR